LIEEEIVEDNQEYELPQQRLLNTIYAISLVIANFYFIDEENEGYGEQEIQGYNLTDPTARSFNVIGVSQLVNQGIGVHSARLLVTQPIYSGGYSITFTNNEEQNLISSSTIAISLANNNVRTDFVLGGGNYQNFLQTISINTNFYWQNFCNILSAEPLQQINNTPLLQNMLGLYCCEVSRCPASLITIPIFYSMFCNNANLRNAINENFQDFGLTANGVNLVVTNPNCTIPPIMLEYGTPSASRTIHGAGIHFINEFFAELNFNWMHSTQPPERSVFTEVKRFGLLQEILITRWYNNLNNEHQINLNHIDIQGYQGNLITGNQANNVMTAILNFFNDNFNMGFDEEDIQERVNLANDILEHPNNTNQLIHDFNIPLAGEIDMNIDVVFEI